MKPDDLYKIAIEDLVRLSIKSNNVILKGSFPGGISNEVKEVLDICEHIYNTFVKEIEEDGIN